MQFGINFTIIVVLLLLPSLSDALSADEISAFVSGGRVESNTMERGFIQIERSGSDRLVVRTNGIPDHMTGIFPEERIPGERGPVNPNSIIPQDFLVNIPENPQIADEPSCLPQGPIGFSLNGVALFSPYDSDGNDANSRERFDDCQGHPNAGGIYHYHQLPDACQYNESNPASIYGVALDGFPIYGPGTGDNEIKNKDLDECHGRFVDGQYRYHMTKTFPYILGCFRGTAARVHSSDDQIMPDRETPKEGPNCKFAFNPEALIGRPTSSAITEGHAPDDVTSDSSTSKRQGVFKTLVVFFIILMKLVQ